MNTKAKFTEQELEDIWTALQFFCDHRYNDKGCKETRMAMRKIIRKIRGRK